MYRGFAIFIFFVTCLPALPAPAETPLRHSIGLILEMQKQGKLADAHTACDAAMRLAEDPAAREADQATLFTTCGNLCSLTLDLQKSRTLLERALALWEKIFGPTHRQVGTTALDLALTHRLAGRYDLSEQHARRALDIFEATFGTESLMLNGALIALSTAEIQVGSYGDAELNLNRVVSLLAKASIESGPDAIAAFSNLGILCFRQGRYLEAERWYRRAAALESRLPGSARILANLARIYVATSRYDKADAAGSKALDALTRSLGPDHDDVAGTLQILAQVRRGQKRYAEEADLLQQALAIVVRTKGPDRPAEAIILNSIGVSYARARRYAEAESTFRRAIRIQEKLGSDARRDIASTLNNLALACNKQGRHGEALELASRAFAIREADLPNADSGLLEIMLHKAELLRRAHRKTEAAKLERAAQEVRAGRHNEDPHRWMVDFRELQGNR